MFNFLKKLFKEKEEKQNIKLNELDQWFKKEKDAKFNETNANINLLKEEFDLITSKLKENLEKLEKAELQNPKISLREIQFMKGNRAFYIKRVKIFLKQLHFPESISELESSCRDFSSLLGDFGKSTAKSYRILQEFFGHESSAIAHNVKQYDNLFKQLNDILSVSSISIFDNLEKSIAELNNKMVHQKELKEQIVSKEREIKSVKEKLDNKKAELKALEESGEQKQVDSLKEKKNEYLKELKDNENLIIHFFATLEMAMKKFYRMTYEYKNIVDEYLKDPVKALVNDSNSMILEVLPKLKTMVEQNAIELKDRKREKTLLTLNQPNNEFLTNFIKKHTELNGKIETINLKIKDLALGDKKKNIRKDINITSLKLDQLNNEKNKLNRDFDNINIEYMKKELQEQIRQFIKKDVEIL